MYRQMSNRKAYEQCLSRNVHKTLKERLEVTEHVLTYIRITPAHIWSRTYCFTYAFLHTWFKLLQSCFGSRLRNPKLGCMHIDKSIYHDQLERWFHNFPCKNFLVSTTFSHVSAGGNNRVADHLPRAIQPKSRTGI
jgi:hypothetical protein